MKTIISTFALSLALCAASGATAQVKSAASVPATDTVLLSKTTDGNYIVCRYIVKNHNDVDYSIRYQISMAKLVPMFDGNTQQLDDLSQFIGSVMSDTLMHVKSAVITGYSSPDGPLMLNEKLAKSRAQDFRNYLDKTYNFSKHCTVTENAVAENWAACRDMVAGSSMPDKQAVLNIIDGTQSQRAKEMAIRKMPAAWSYLKKNVLPSMRRVGLMINYGEGNIVEQRTLIPQPKAPEPVPYEVVDETVTGIIVEMPGAQTDYKKMTCKERKEVRKAEKLVKKEARIAEKLAKKELKAAAKIAKKDAKQVRKMEKAAAKAAKKSAKDLAKSMK